MLQKQFTLPTEQIGRVTSHFTVGFGNLHVVQDGVADISSAGSGTLTTIGSIHGILTAAHVIDALPKKGPVGIITYGGDSGRLQPFTIEMANATPVVIRKDAFTVLGPDLGFLRLPSESVGWLTAQNSFYNLVRYRNDVLLNKEPASDHIDIVTGIVNQLTMQKTTGDEPGTWKRLFTVLFCRASLVAMRYVDDLGLYYFLPSNEVDFTLPENFEGMSGGAVWRLYVSKNANDKLNVVDRRLIAVPFYQSPPLNGERELICQGPRGIYRSLIDAVTNKWPNEASRMQ